VSGEGASGEERDWSRSGVEPAPAEALADPVVQLLMHRDGVATDDIWALIETVRHGHHCTTDTTSGAVANHASNDEERRDGEQPAV